MEQTNPWLQFTSVRPPAASGTTDEVSEQLPLQAPEKTEVAGEAVEVVAAPATGPTAPQPFVEPPASGLPVRVVTETASLWWVGAHGGSGESTLASLDEQWQAAGRCWPTPSMPGVVASCVLVARTHADGLMAAQRALQQWSASAAGPGVQLLGLVLVADAPGKLPVPLRDLVKVISGGAPRVWEVPWVEAWRFGNPEEHVPRAVARIVKQINITLSELTALS